MYTVQTAGSVSIFDQPCLNKMLEIEDVAIMIFDFLQPRDLSKLVEVNQEFSKKVLPLLSKINTRRVNAFLKELSLSPEEMITLSLEKIHPSVFSIHLDLKNKKNCIIYKLAQKNDTELASVKKKGVICNAHYFKNTISIAQVWKQVVLTLSNKDNTDEAIGEKRVTFDNCQTQLYALEAEDLGRRVGSILLNYM